MGNTHLLAVDVARLYGETVAAAEARISRGRDKIAAWLSLIERLEDVGEGGCGRCGAPECGGGPRCDARLAATIAIRDRLPLEAAVTMNAPRWRAAAGAITGPALAINVESA